MFHKIPKYRVSMGVANEEKKQKGKHSEVVTRTKEIEILKNRQNRIGSNYYTNEDFPKHVIENNNCR